MENKSQILAFCLSLMWLLSSEVLAGDAQLSPEGAAALEKGETLQREAAALRERANQRLSEEEARCADKLLVNDCRNEARTRHLEAVREARRMDAEGRELEYQARLEERTLKQQQREADAARREEALQQRQTTRETQILQRDAAREKKRAEKEAKASEGERKTAERQAKQEKKRKQLEKNEKKNTGK